MADIVDLERRWSRFVPDSELSKVNHRSGSPVIVSAAAFDLVSRAIAGRHRDTLDERTLCAGPGGGRCRARSDPERDHRLGVDAVLETTWGEVIEVGRLATTVG